MFRIIFASQTFLLKLFPSWSTCFRNVFNEDLLVTNCLQLCLSENIFIELLLLKYIFATFKVSWHLIPFSVFIPWLWYQQSICYLFAIRCFLLDDFQIFLSSVFSIWRWVMCWLILIYVVWYSLNFLIWGRVSFVISEKPHVIILSSFSFIPSEPSCVMQVGCMVDLHLVIFSLLLLLHLYFPFLFFCCIMTTFFTSAFQFTHSLFNYI